MVEWNVASIQRARIRRKVSLAVLVMDDFSGKPVSTPDIKFTAVEVLTPPVRKPDGHFLYLDCPAETLTFTIDAWNYHSRTVTVHLPSLPPLRPVVRVRLSPNRNYPIPASTTCIEGIAPPNTQVHVICENDPRPLRLLYDYSKKGAHDGRLIQLYDPTEGHQDGRQFALQRKADKGVEFFEVAEGLDDGDGSFLLIKPLDKDCKKVGTTILPVASATSDKQGRFFLPLSPLAIRQYDCRLFWLGPKGKWMEQTTQLESGRVTRLDLTTG